MVLTMEELDIELEALQHTFDADSLDIARANDFVITARLQPRTGWGADDHAAQFVLCSVRCGWPGELGMLYLPARCMLDLIPLTLNSG